MIGFKPMTTKVILMRAPSGFGKSTWIKNNVPHATICSADDFFVKRGNGTYSFDARLLGVAHKHCLQAFKDAVLRGDKLVVVDNTNLRKSWYKEYVEFSKVNDVELYQKVLTERFTNVHGVPEEKVNQMISNFEEDETIPHWK